MINCFLKIPFKFKDICIIYPPSVEETVLDSNFGNYKVLFTISQEELEDEFMKQENSELKDFKVPTPFEFLLLQAHQSNHGYDLVKKAFWFFTKTDVTILFDRQEIWLCDLEKVLKETKDVEELLKIKKIDKNNFFDFQNAIRESIGEKQIEPPNPNEDPRVKRIKAKARYRDKIKAKKGMGINLETNLMAICCMNMGLNPLNIGKISLASVGKLTEMYQNKEKYDIDTRALIAGADAKKIKLSYWIK